MRLLSLVLCLMCLPGLALAASAQVRRAPGSNIPLPFAGNVADDRIERLEQWLKLVAHHTPGEEDAALAEIAAWPNERLKELWLDTNVLVQLMRKIGGDETTFAVRPAEPKTSVRVGYSKPQVLRLRVLACGAGGLLFDPVCMLIKAGDQLDPELRQMAVLARAAAARGDRNYLVRHGALLHSDVAILKPLAMAAPGAIGPPSGGPERMRMEINDGQEIDLRQSAVHWEIARMLLDLVIPRDGDRPAPGRDEMVRQWYRATASWMQLREDHDKLHLDRARQLFPSDPDILFLSACQRETYAGVPIQTAMRSAVLPAGVSLDVGSPRVELREAEGLFRRVLEIKPDYAEARLRYGRVMGALGKHAEAAGELRRAVGDLTDRQLLYYAELFLGGEEEALGNRDAARVAYEEAAGLFPMAQSPLLALSQLARRYGDRGGALRAIDRLFALPGEDRTEKDDPWWWYYVAQARDADDLLEAMQRPYLEERLP